MIKKLKNKNQITIAIAIALIFLSCLSCAYAQDLNDTDSELNLNSNDQQELELATPASDVKSDDNDILSSESPNKDSKAFLVLDNDANIENIYLGDYVVWIVSVLNEGPDTAKNVRVYDKLPDGLEYVKHTTTKGTFNPKTGIWNIGDLSIKDGEVFLNITTLAKTVGEKINKAKVATDSDNLNKNESYEEEEIDVLEHEKEVEKQVEIRSVGNPIALILISFFALFITSVKSK